MEVVGLVLGGIPLAIAALKCYKTGKRLTDLVRNRKRHIEALIRALEGYNGYLELLVDWLLRSVNIYVDVRDHDISYLLQNPETVKKMREFLGPRPSSAFQNAIYDGQQAVIKIVINIGDFLPGNQAPSNVLEAITQMSFPVLEVRFCKGIKLTLRKNEIDEQIKILKTSADDLQRLHNVSDSIYPLNVSIRSNSPQKLVNSLGRTRNYADRLYTAISRSWTPDCHSTHEAKLVLEDRVDKGLPSKHLSKKQQKQALSFQVVFTSEPSVGSDPLWYESEIKVIEDSNDQDEQSGTGLSQHIPSSQTSIKVTFSTPPLKFVAEQITTEIKDICLSVREAKHKQKMLQLYLNSQHKFHYDHVANIGIDLVSSQPTSTISLEALLSASSQTTKLSNSIPPIKSRLLLGLNLASTLLQLKATPWLATLWSKSTIYFLTPSSSSTHSQIDLTRPLISVKFNSGVNSHNPPNLPEARRVILELGIMLLELWHGTTLEAHYAASGNTVGTDYLDRATSAQRWLENSDDSGLVLPSYVEYVARCIKCNFGPGCLNPTWNSDELIQGIVEKLIEPLRDMCRPSE